MIKTVDLREYKDSLKHLAFKPEDSLGRRFERDQDSRYGSVLDPFLIDREKIRLSKSYRRLSGVTQVFPPSLHSFVRNRSSHTNDVVDVACIIATILGLNVYLVEAMAYGHDIGQTPYGHSGEKYISINTKRQFFHNFMSVVTAQFVERKGFGLNLTFETLSGILHHSRGAGELMISKNSNQEETLVMYADKIAYTFSDLNDAIRTGFLKRKDVPSFAYFFGENQRERVFKAITELLKESSQVGSVSFSLSETAKTFAILKNWMYKNVYFKVNDVYNKRIFEKMDKCLEVVDKKFNSSKYLALSLMTDNEVDLISSVELNGDFSKLPFLELFSPVYDSEINIFDADLNTSLFKREYLY